MLVKSVTDLEIEEAIRDAWRIVQGGSASASLLARESIRNRERLLRRRSRLRLGWFPGSR